MFKIFGETKDGKQTEFGETPFEYVANGMCSYLSKLKWLKLAKVWYRPVNEVDRVNKPA